MPRKSAPDDGRKESPVARRVYHILAQLREKRQVRVAELAQELGVSEVTIREDVNWLAEAGALEKFHGGARPAGSAGHAYSGLYQARSQINPAGKDLIAAYAVAQLIRDGDHLLLDSGTSVEAFVRHLGHYPRSGIRALTQAANFALHFLNIPDSNYVQLGGYLHKRSVLFADVTDQFDTGKLFEKFSEDILRRYCKGAADAPIAGAARLARDRTPADGSREAAEGEKPVPSPYKAVLGASAYSAERGMATSSVSAKEYKQRLIRACSEVIFLVDHSKFELDEGRTFTRFGLGPDEWLPPGVRKPARLIVDWPARAVPPELAALAKRLTPEELPEEVAAAFPGVRVFRTEIHNGPASAPPR